MGFVKAMLRGLLSIVNFSSPLNPKVQINKTDKGTYLHSMLYHSTSTSYNFDAYFSFKPEMDLKWCMIGFIVDTHKGDKYAIKLIYWWNQS